MVLAVQLHGAPGSSEGCDLTAGRWSVVGPRTPLPNPFPGAADAAGAGTAQEQRCVKRSDHVGALRAR